MSDEGHHTPHDGAAIRLGVLDEVELVTTGLAGMLHPHRDRVELAVLHTPSTTAGLDVVLCDPFQQDADARRVVARASSLGPARVLVYTWNTHAPALHQVLEAGAVAVLGKSASTHELLAAVEDAGRGDPPVPSPRRGAVFPMLSARESEVLALICQGLSNLEIAAALYVSVNSVKTYIRQIYRKTGVSRRTQAVDWAHRHGYRR